MPGVIETYVGQERRRQAQFPASEEALDQLRAERDKLLDQLVSIRNGETVEGRRDGHKMLGDLRHITDALRAELEQRAATLAGEVREYEETAQSVTKSQAETDRYRQALIKQAYVARELQELLPPLRAKDNEPTLERERLKAQVTTYGEGFRESCAERELARKLAAQINSGATEIDLSQRYLTSDPAVARARHERALKQLAPFVRKAEQLGCSVHAGEAIAASMKEAQRLACAGAQL